MLVFTVTAFPAVGLVAAQTAPAAAGAAQSSSREEIIRAIEGHLSEQERAGFSGAVLLAKGDEIILKAGYGLADRQERKRVSLETGFDLGSIVKLFTAAAVFKLESQGKLDTSAPLSKFFKNVPPDKAGITVQQILNHTSGLPDFVDKDLTPVPEDDAGTDFDLEPISSEELTRRTLGVKLLFKPGEKFEYSNLGYSLLGVIIEKTSGRPYEKYLRGEIFEPAGMRKTGYVLPGWRRKDLAVGYRKGSPVGTPLEYTYLTDGPTWSLRANGGMVSTAGDLYRWIRALSGDRMLTKDARAKFFELVVPKTARGPRRMSFLGSNGIFTAAFRWYVDEGSILIGLTNVAEFPANKVMGELSTRVLALEKKR